MHVLTDRSRRLSLLCVALATIAASGCRSRGDEFDMRGSAERVHSEAVHDLDSGNYPTAIQKLELLEARFPFSDSAKQGQLDLMYAYYKNRETESAIDQADQFIRENPTHPRVDYAYYIRGLVYFEGGASWIERAFKADMAKRPPQEARSSFQSFQTLVQQYPNSPYAADARQRMVYLRNRLADYELAVAKYYMTRGAYVGALNRARGLIETYDGAPAVTGALKVMEKAYRELDMGDLALVAQQVRAENASPDIVSPSAAAAGLALSQGTGDGGRPPVRAALREGRWEGRLGASVTNTSDVDFKGGTAAEIDGGVGFALGVAYHYTDRLQLGSTFSYDQKDYEAEVAGDEPGESVAVKGSLDSMTLMVDFGYNFLAGPFTPFVTGGIGWSWVDTNIVNGLPDVGCWWDPWWGYICFSSANTRTIDGLTYEAGVGLRYDFSDIFAVDGAYRMRWVDFANATGTPSFDSLQLNFGWKF
jgi:outer membrane protein assembly factor BamD